MAWQVGVDVGGTFTDLLALDPDRGVFRVAKVLSTPEDQAIGFIAGLSSSAGAHAPIPTAACSGR